MTGTSTRPVEYATDAQVWRIRKERGQRDTSRVQMPADADIPKMSKRAAHTLIDKLVDDRNLCPLLPAGQAPRRAYAPNRATDGQKSYVRDLLAERVHADPVDVDALTFDQASALLDVLVHATRKIDVVDLPDGPYRKDGVIYRIKRHPRTGRVQCQRAAVIEPAVTDQAGSITRPAVVKFRSAQFEVGRLTVADRMSEAEITDFGVTFGVCVFGHLLTDPISVAAGIGPKCADNLGIDRFELAAAKGVTVPKRRARKPAQVPGQPGVVDPVDAAEPEFVSGWGGCVARFPGWPVDRLAGQQPPCYLVSVTATCSEASNDHRNRHPHRHHPRHGRHVHPRLDLSQPDVEVAPPRNPLCDRWAHGVRVHVLRAEHRNRARGLPHGRTVGVRRVARGRPDSDRGPLL
jgi:hypothetical protein